MNWLSPLLALVKPARKPRLSAEQREYIRNYMRRRRAAERGGKPMPQRTKRSFLAGR